MQSVIHKNVMRRVYYSYALSFAFEPMLWQGFVLGACVALFGRLTHVASIVHNFTQVSLMNVPSFVFNSFVHAIKDGEVLTALVTLFMIALSVSFIVRLMPLFVPLRTYRPA